MKTVAVFDNDVLKVGVAVIVVNDWRERQHLFDVALIHEFVSVVSSLKSLDDVLIAAAVSIKAD